VGRYRWLILAAGTLAATSLSAVQIGISAIAPDLQEEFALSLGQVGILLAATNAGMTMTLLGWGIVSDRIGERRAIVIGLTGSALALAVAANVNAFPALVAALVATGAFGASVNSASGRAVMHWFERDERGLALGIRQAAIPIGGFAGAIALPAIVAAAGVSAAFIACSASSFTLPRMVEPRKPLSPSDRLRFTLANQKPSPRDGSGTRTRSSIAVQK